MYEGCIKKNFTSIYVFKTDPLNLPKRFSFSKGGQGVCRMSIDCLMFFPLFQHYLDNTEFDPNVLEAIRYRVFIKYCVFFEDFKIFRTLAFLCFLSVSVYVHTTGR